MLFGKRRNYLINKEFQLQFIAILIMAALLASIQLVGAVLFLDANIEQEAAKYGLNADPVILSFIIVQHKQMLMQIFMYVGLTIFLMALFGMYFSHRIAGPIYKINKFLGELISSGDLSHDLRLRRTDQFQEVAVTINQLLAKLRDERSDQHDVLNQLKERLSKNGGSKEVISMIEEITSNLAASKNQMLAPQKRLAIFRTNLQLMA